MLLLIFSQIASAHPGKTDYQNGHKCSKNCGDWNLNYDEYHLHDKDGNPIRVERKKKPVNQMVPEEKVESATPAPQETKVPVQSPPIAVQPVIDKTDRNTVVQEFSQPITEGYVLTLYDIILFAVAVLLVLIIVLLKRKRDGD